MQLQKCSYFAVNILRPEHLSLADQFAGSGGLHGADRYGRAKILPRYGHAIIIGRIRAIAIRADGYPLLHWRGDYQQIVQKQTN
jgi:flavin reductase (DIM6/NTAB) family NADH-FMN oxidoreductase RutF